MPTIVESSLKHGKFWKTLTGNLKILLHGILPHKNAEEPPNVFSAKNITEDAEFLLSTAQEFYKEISERIEFLEEKGFKLMTYITAVSALPIFLLSQEPEGVYKWAIIVSIILLTLALLISLRCIGIKSQKAIYIDAIFTFDDTGEVEPKNKSKKDIIASLINCAVFNQNVADNTADLIKATRIFLSLGIIATLVSSFFYLSGGPKKKEKEVSKAIINFNDSTVIYKFNQHFKMIESMVEDSRKGPAVSVDTAKITP
ncbi:hypothetical protein [Flavihumibacter sp. CACIAM 22H1]|uniref:hypothetical protein n=1 Tax=Flavihumibacter sp. CACIAM 22H1 TaxID=1812911 RepID=UPI0025C132A3|nr:hypothetical protein [Flavihumibacter sp. CACIAM 22H1]